MKTFEVTVYYTGYSTYLVDAPSESAARELAYVKYGNGEPDDIVGAEDVNGMEVAEVNE